jgi:hypothetical protein
MFPHEEYLLKAIKCVDFRMIGLLHDLGNLYIGAMANRPEGDSNFQKVMEIGRAIQDCSKRIAEIQGDDPVSGGHASDIVM